MPAKKKFGFFIALFLLSTLARSVGALPDTTATFSGGGVTIELTFPEEAHPDTNITNYIKIASTTAATLRNFTVVVKAPVNSSWQEILNSQDTFSKPLPLNYNLTLKLPQEANGMLEYFIFVNTSKIDDLSTKVYTTLVSKPTFSEMLVDYTTLQANYTTLLNTYNGLLANYSILLDNYTALLSEYDSLSNQYDTQVSNFQKLLDDYNDLSNDYKTLDNDYETLDTKYNSKISELNDLQVTYEELNTTQYSLQGNYTSLQGNYASLQTDYGTLSQAYSDLLVRNTRSESALNSDRIVMFIFIVAVAALITFIVYLKRKQQEPYVVIRKETVSMKPEEES